LTGSLRKTLAIFAHPGHELQCLFALKRQNATVAFLTDASAGTGHARVVQSTTGLKTLGLGISTNWTPIADQALYEMLMDRDQCAILALNNAIQNLLRHERPQTIITDAAEGYNPAHDFCHFLVMAAVQMACPHARLVETPLTDDPHDMSGHAPSRCMVFDLTAPEVQQKSHAIDAYCEAAGGILQQEVRDMREQFGEAVIARELLRPALSQAAYLNRFEKEKPFFERHGERRVLEGKYDTLLRLHPHLVAALDIISDPVNARPDYQ
jgi:LmbE family N-acetylglucosaminyl deacetylase